MNCEESLLNVGVPVYLVKNENVPFFTLTVDIEKTLHTLEDIQQQIFLTKFHENSTLPGAVNSVFDSAPKIELTPPQ